MYSAPLSAPRRKRPREGETLQQSLPVPIASLTGIRANNSIWRWYAGALAEDCVTVREGRESLWERGYFGEVAGEEEGDKYASVALKEVEPGKDDDVIDGGHAGDGGTQDDVTHRGRVGTEQVQDDRVRLNFCEAFFLSYALGCLVVSTAEDGRDGPQELSLDAMWNTFSKEKDFPQRYAVYVMSFNVCFRSLS
jgi:hypothetical protein